MNTVPMSMNDDHTSSLLITTFYTLQSEMWYNLSIGTYYNKLKCPNDTISKPNNNSPNVIITTGKGTTE